MLGALARAVAKRATSCQDRHTVHDRGSRQHVYRWCESPIRSASSPDSRGLACRLTFSSDSPTCLLMISGPLTT